jgi:hypothetical protein
MLIIQYQQFFKKTGGQTIIFYYKKAAIIHSQKINVNKIYLKIFLVGKNY